nr:hypothetical protein [Tanacetum cinerariifolium]
NTQQFGALLPIELTNDEIRNSKAYKEYYAIAIGEVVPKPKASVRRTRSSFDTSITPPTTTASSRLKASAKGKQPTKASKAKNLYALSEVAMTEAQQPKLVTKRSMQQTHISQPSGLGADEGTGDDNEEKDDDGDEEDEGDDGEEVNGDEDNDGNEGDDDDDADQEVVRDDDKDDNEEGGDDEHESDEETQKEESFDPVLQTHEDSEDEGNGKEDLGLNIDEEERHDEEEDKDELYRDVNINQGRGLQGTLEVEDTHVTLTPVKPDGQQESSSVSSQFVTSMLNLTLDLKLVLKRSMQQTHISQPNGLGADEGTGSKPGFPDVPTDESVEELSWNSTDDEEESFDPIPQTLEDSEDEGDGEEDLGLNIGDEERHDEEDELYPNVNINQGRGHQGTLEVEDTHVTLTLVKHDGQQESSSVSSQFVTSMLNPTLDVGLESIFETTSRIDVQSPTSVAPLPITTPTMTSSTIATTTPTSQAPTLPTTIPSEIIQNLPSFGSLFCFDDRLRSLEQNFSERMNEVVKVAIQIQSDRLREEAQRENDEFLRIVDENIKKIIKEQVKKQVKAQVSKILPRIERAVNKQLEAEVLTRSSHSSRTSYAIDADLSEMELKKILIEKMEGNKSIQRSDQQRNFYKALVNAYESDKIILDTYDKDEEPSAGPDRGSKRRKEGKEPESVSAPSETATKSAGRVDTLTPELLAGPTYNLMKGSCKILIELEYHLEEVYKAVTDQLDWVNPEGQQYPHNLLQPLPLISDNRGHRVIPFAHFINNDLEYLHGDYDKHALWGVSHWRRRRQQFYGFAINRESARDVYSKRRIIAVAELKIVEWRSYKHLDWITVRCDDDKLYKFKEGDYKRLRIQDIEDMLLLLVQGKLTNLTVEECFAFNKRLNLTKPDTYRSDLKRKEAYTAYSNPRGFIYQNKDKKIRLMRIDELHKFSDGTLTDVHTALDDRLKGIRIRYLPQTIWRKSDKDKAAAMIQAIDKRLKTMRIMRSLERFVGGRLYEGDFRMLHRTI